MDLPGRKREEVGKEICLACMAGVHSFCTPKHDCGCLFCHYGTEEQPNPRAIERQPVLTAAAQAIMAAMKDGEAHGYPIDNWRGISITDHLSHGFRHAENAKNWMGPKRWYEDVKRELEHEIARTAFAYLLLCEKIEKDKA